jgi:hypothetical protein
MVSGARDALAREPQGTNGRFPLMWITSGCAVIQARLCLTGWRGPDQNSLPPYSQAVGRSSNTADCQSVTVQMEWPALIGSDVGRQVSTGYVMNNDVFGFEDGVCAEVSRVP